MSSIWIRSKHHLTRLFSSANAVYQLIQSPTATLAAEYPFIPPCPEVTDLDVRRLAEFIRKHHAICVLTGIYPFCIVIFS